MYVPAKIQVQRSEWRRRKQCCQRPAPLKFLDVVFTLSNNLTKPKQYWVYSSTKRHSAQILFFLSKSKARKKLS